MKYLLILFSFFVLFNSQSIANEVVGKGLVCSIIDSDSSIQKYLHFKSDSVAKILYIRGDKIEGKKSTYSFPDETNIYVKYFGTINRETLVMTNYPNKYNCEVFNSIEIYYLLNKIIDDEAKNTL